MTPHEADELVNAHLLDAQEKHPPVRDRGEALRRIAAQIGKAAAEHNSGEEADKATRFARRIAQLGALCLRTLIDLSAPPAKTCPSCGEPLK